MAQQELDGPPLPEGFEYLWWHYCELHAVRSYSQVSPNAISYVEMEAWARVTGRRLAEWEFGMLRTMDMAWLAGKRGTDDQRQA